MQMFLLLLIVGWITPVGTGHPQTERRGLRLIVVSKEVQGADLRARIQAGASFEALAKEHSIDPSAAAGGHIGAIIVSDLQQELQVALGGLGPGEISPVTRVGNEFFLLQWI